MLLDCMAPKVGLDGPALDGLTPETPLAPGAPLVYVLGIVKEPVAGGGTLLAEFIPKLCDSPFIPAQPVSEAIVTLQIAMLEERIMDLSRPFTNNQLE